MAADSEPEAGSEPLGLSDRSALVLYGSETGHAQDIAEDLGRAIERLRFRTSVEEMDDANLRELLQYGQVVFVISTTGQGDVPQNATKFWKSLLRRKLPPLCLARVKFTSFGLGDSSYPRFNWAARKLNKRLIQLGAQEFFASGEGDERHDDGIDTICLPWSQRLRSHIVTHYPLPSHLLPVPDDVTLPQRFTLGLDHPGTTTSEPQPTRRLARSLAEPGQSTGERDSRPGQRPVPDGLLATVQSIRRVTPADHWQDVRLLTLDVDRPKGDGITLQPGATLMMHPRNRPADVDALVERMGWQDVADQPLPVLSSVPSSPARLPKGLWCAEAYTLRDLLTHSLDITAVPRRSFLEKLSFMTPASNEKERLRELADPAGSQEFYDYTSRPRRTILEILADFPAVRISPDAVLDVFPLIRGREFSIARCDDGGGDRARLRVELLAALVEYRTIIRKPRVGLCSGYIKTLQAGSRITVTVKSGSSLAQKDGDQCRPVIAIATGTGIAPVRMLHHTRLRKAPPAPGKMLLFFGCRNRAADFYFADEWLASPDTVTVVPAFSRDRDAVLEEEAAEGQGQVPGRSSSMAVAAAATEDPTSPSAAILRQDKGKNYVQHHIRRHADEICELVRRGALVCICGTAGNMPKAVRLALEDALVAGGLCASAAAAEEYLATKVSIWQETW